MNAWKRVAKYCERAYNCDVNWDEQYFLCPECGEPIYKDDWYDNDDLHNGLCPICEAEISK